jgi:hypothetical protein
LSHSLLQAVASRIELTLQLRLQFLPISDGEVLLVRGCSTGISVFAMLNVEAGENRRLAPMKFRAHYATLDRAALTTLRQPARH